MEDIIITGHAVCAPVVEINPDGSVRFGLMEYTYTDGRTSFRHIMETGKNGDNILKTLDEGVFKEGARDRTERSKFDWEILSTEPVHVEVVDDQRHPRSSGKKQVKPAFPVRIHPEHLRDFPAKDDDNEGEVHGPFKMYDFLEVLDLEKRMIPYHFRATRSAMVWAARRPKVMDRYYRHIIGWSQQPLSEAELKAIQAYPGKW